jgi:hypothetical protein
MVRPSAPPTIAASAEHGAPAGYTARPRTLAERLEFLIADAQRILANPTAFRPEERSWATDMVRATNAEARR